jgi:DNA gyrase/topoisomerase IV subunit B
MSVRHTVAGKSWRTCGAVEPTRPTRTDTVLLQTLHGSVLNVWVTDEAKIVVGSEIQAILTVHGNSLQGLTEENETLQKNTQTRRGYVILSQCTFPVTILG